MIRNSLIALLLFVFCAKCHAQQVRLRVYDSNIISSVGYGGCVRIGISQKNSNWLYATAAHNVRNVRRIEVLLDNRWQIASVVGRDNKNDIAVIVSFPGKEKIRSYRIGDDAKAGEKVKLKGLYLGKKKRDLWGIALNGSEVDTIEKSVIVGDSGCPYFRHNSELVGIQSAKIPETKRAIMVPASRLKALLIRSLGYIPPQPNVQKKRVNKELPLQKVKNNSTCQIILYSGSLCGHCQKWKRDELPKLRGITIQIIEDNQKANAQAGVTSYPTFIAMQSGKEVARKVGYTTANEIQAMCSQTKNRTCLRCLPQIVKKCNQCRQRFNELAQQLKSLDETIFLMNTEIAKLQNKPDNSKELAQLQSQLRRANLRIQALEPLLKRRLILESATGEISTERTYEPDEPIRIRGIYRSKIKKK